MVQDSQIIGAMYIYDLIGGHLCACITVRARLASTQLRADRGHRIPPAVWWRHGDSHLMQCAHAHPEQESGMHHTEHAPQPPSMDALIMKTLIMVILIIETPNVQYTTHIFDRTIP
jgi:hypothetical protein